MSRFHTVDLSVCQDCAMIGANGELGQGDEDAERAHVERMSAVLGDDLRHIVIGEQTDDFATSPCGACGDTLAGERFSACLLIPDTNRA